MLLAATTLLICAIAQQAVAQQAPAPQNYALRFNGATDFLAAPTYVAATNDFTMEAWINPTETHEIDREAQTGIDGIKGQHYVIFPNHGTNCWGKGHAGVGFSAGTNGVSVYEHAADYMPAVLVYEGKIAGWTHVAVVYHDRTPQLYINGALVKTGAQSSYPFVHPSAGDHHPGREIGGIGGGEYGYFKGEIDDARIWDTPMCGCQIRKEMKGTMEVSPHLLVNFDMNRTGEGRGLALASNSPLKSTMLTATTFGTSATPVFVPRENVLTGGAPQIGSATKKSESASVTIQVAGTIGSATPAQPQTPSPTPAMPAIHKPATAATTAGVTLEGNIPNPFSGSTTITYTLPTAGHATLKVFDDAGREISTLVDAEVGAGKHEVLLDAAAMPQSGNYFYQLIAGGASLTRSMIVVK
jgi:hypothetical protein